MIIFRSSLLTPPNAILAKADSGASGHCFKPSDRTVLSALRSTPFGPTVMLPDSTNMQVTHAGQLPLHSSLSAKAKTAHILDGMTNSSLISIGQLCDDDCVAALDNFKSSSATPACSAALATKLMACGTLPFLFLALHRPADPRHHFNYCEAQSWVLVNHVFCHLSPNPA
jgi:hypothetical protein